jgi:hypothetical protein
VLVPIVGIVTMLSVGMVLQRRMACGSRRRADSSLQHSVLVRSSRIETLEVGGRRRAITAAGAFRNVGWD